MTWLPGENENGFILGLHEPVQSKATVLIVTCIRTTSNTQRQYTNKSYINLIIIIITRTLGFRTAAANAWSFPDTSLKLSKQNKTNTK